MKNVSIRLYSFSELSDTAKQKAVYDHAIFLNEIDAKGRIFEDDETIDAIESNEYLFFEDGVLARCTQYTGTHPKSGTLEFHFHGRTYDITNA